MSAQKEKCRSKPVGTLQSILISTLLLLSMLVSTVQSLTITDPDPITPQNVLVGDMIDVAGTDATPGALVEVYWDMVTSENKLKEILSEVDGTFSCEVTIPEDVQGDHWIIVDGQSFGSLLRTSSNCCFERTNPFLRARMRDD